MMEGVLVSSSTSSLSLLGWIPSSPLRSRLSEQLSRSLTNFSLIERGSILLLVPVYQLTGLVALIITVLLKAEAKQALNILFLIFSYNVSLCIQ